jgi:hypothetical protein
MTDFAVPLSKSLVHSYDRLHLVASLGFALVCLVQHLLRQLGSTEMQRTKRLMNESGRLLRDVGRVLRSSSGDAKLGCDNDWSRQIASLWLSYLTFYSLSELQRLVTQDSWRG